MSVFDDAGKPLCYVRPHIGDGWPILFCGGAQVELSRDFIIQTMKTFLDALEAHKDDHGRSDRA